MEMKGVHPAADVWPMLGSDDLDALAADIAENGLQNPLVLTPDGLLLDGRNRLAACKLVDVTPTFEMYDGEPLAFIVSANLHRRHITKGQQAMCVAMMYPEKRQGERTDTTSQRIWEVGSGEYLRMARTVLAEDVHEAEKVRDGSVALAVAYETVQSVIKRRKAEQQEMERLRSHPAALDWVLEDVTEGKLTVKDGLRVLDLDEEDAERVRSGRISVDEGEVLTRDRNAAHHAQIIYMVKSARAWISCDRIMRGLCVDEDEDWDEMMDQLDSDERANIQREVDRWTTK